MIDKKGFRSGIGIILVDSTKQVFLGRRMGQNAWQFPQGGLISDETPEQAMYRELREEIGLESNNVEILSCSKDWLRYRLPKCLIRYHSKPICIGQRQKWFLLQLIADESKIRFDLTEAPEFDAYRWVDYWFPLHRVVYFKRQVYQEALKEFSTVLFP